MLRNKTQKANQTIKELQRQVKELEAHIEKLSQDSNYGIFNRAAVDLHIVAIEKDIKNVVFLDVDYLHEFNSRFGHEEANRRIREALHIRSSDILLSSRWYSGDEIIFLISGDPEGFINRLGDSFKSQGMSATIASSEFTGKLESDVARAKAKVDQSKAARGDKR